jgi:hypothetical protein
MHAKTTFCQSRYGHTVNGIAIQVSYTPIVGMFLNWPPGLRSLLASIWMFGILPPKCKDYQQMLLPVVQQLAKYIPGPTGEDLVTKDADTGTDLHLRVVLSHILNDIRAVPCGTCGSHPPAYVGSCNMCTQVGRRVHNRIVLGGAVRGTGVGNNTSHTTHNMSIPQTVCHTQHIPLCSF